MLVVILSNIRINMCSKLNLFSMTNSVMESWIHVGMWRPEPESGGGRREAARGRRSSIFTIGLVVVVVAVIAATETRIQNLTFTIFGEGALN